MKTHHSNHLISRMCLGLVIATAVPAALANNPDEKFAKMDSNKDGKISRTEHSSGARDMFSLMDKNRDNIVTPQEMDAKNDKPEGSQQREAMATRDSGAGRDGMSAKEKIKVIDENGDGLLSAGEHAKGSEAMFDKMDTNRDGSLTREEMAAGHKGM